MKELHGGDWTGEATTVTALDRPFWVKLTAFDGVKYYSWSEYTPITAATFEAVVGGRSGTNTLNPVFDPNLSTLTLNSFVQVRRAYFDTTLDWVYVVLGTPSTSSGGATLTVQNLDGTGATASVTEIDTDQHAGLLASTLSANKAKITITWNQTNPTPPVVTLPYPTPFTSGSPSVPLGYWKILLDTGGGNIFLTTISWNSGTPNDGQLLHLDVIGGGFVQISNNAGSPPNLGVLTPNGNNYSLFANDGIILEYSASQSRWRFAHPSYPQVGNEYGCRQITAGTGITITSIHTGVASISASTSSALKVQNIDTTGATTSCVEIDTNNAVGLIASNIGAGKSEITINWTAAHPTPPVVVVPVSVTNDPVSVTAGSWKINADTSSGSFVINSISMNGGTPENGQLLYVWCSGPGTVTLKNNTGSPAAVGITTPLAKDYKMQTNDGLLLEYSATLSRWRFDVPTLAVGSGGSIEYGCRQLLAGTGITFTGHGDGSSTVATVSQLTMKDTSLSPTVVNNVTLIEVDPTNGLTFTSPGANTGKIGVALADFLQPGVVSLTNQIMGFGNKTFSSEIFVTTSATINTSGSTGGSGGLLRVYGDGVGIGSLLTCRTCTSGARLTLVGFGGAGGDDITQSGPVNYDLVTYGAVWARPWGGSGAGTWYGGFIVGFSGWGGFPNYSPSIVGNGDHLLIGFSQADVNGMGLDSGSFTVPIFVLAQSASAGGLVTNYNLVKGLNLANGDIHAASGVFQCQNTPGINATVNYNKAGGGTGTLTFTGGILTGST